MRLVSYNILCGGFDTYGQDKKNPERLELIVKAIKSLKADFVALIDTYRWKEVFSDKQLKEIFGFKEVYSIELGDGRMEKYGYDTGITVLSNVEMISFEKITIGNCQAIKSQIRNGKEIMDIFTIYLEVIREDVRMGQVEGLLKLVDNKYPTILMGDFNSIDDSDLSPLVRFGILTAAKIIGDKIFETALPEMMKGRVTRLIKEKGFLDANESRKPTIPSKLFVLPIPFPFLRLDYAFYNKKVKKMSFEVKSGGIFEQSSDHFPIVLDIENR